MHVFYKWFLGLYHENLYNFLAGFDCNMDPTQTNQFNGVIGIVTLLVVALLACLFYFVRHAKFNGILSWFVVWLLVAGFSFGFGLGYVKSQSHEIPNYVIYGIENCEDPDSATDEYGFYAEEDDFVNVGCNSMQPFDWAVPMVTNQTYIGFGFANMIIGMLWFLLFSFIMKRFSRDCRHTPWPSIWPKH